MKKWLQVVGNGFGYDYFAVDDAKRFSMLITRDSVRILMWVDYDIENCILVDAIDYDESDFQDVLTDAKRELEFIINYISDGDVCAYEQYTQHINIRYVEEVND